MSISTEAGWPDIDDLLCTLFDAALTTGTVTPADLQDHLPFVRFTRGGGDNDRFTDRARVTADVFARTRAQARAISEGIRQTLVAAPLVVGAARIDRAAVVTGPVELPWDDTKTRRFATDYLISFRR